MNRYLLDTNIISNLVKPRPSEKLVEWMQEQDDLSLFIASLTLAEIQRGILIMTNGSRRTELQAWFSGPEGPQALFSGRVLPFDSKAALLWAERMASGGAAGKTPGAFDAMIAAVAVAHGCIVVTDNEKDFSGIPLLNPTK